MLDYIKQFALIIIGEGQFYYLDNNAFVDILSVLILSLIFYGIVKLIISLGKWTFTAWR